MNAEEQAYVDGFCKAAEAVGVDPRHLARRLAVKEAALGKSAAGAGTMVGRALGAVGRGFRRYGQLLRGGNPALVGQYRDAWARTKAFNNQMYDMRGSFTGRPVGPVARAIGNAMSRMSHDAAWYTPLGSRIMSMFGVPPERIKSLDDTRHELQKALATRLGTAGAVGAGIYAASQD